MIDVVTVGAGGGSIAWLSPEGTLKVGPQSAGADPGPLCYAKGGTEPTITDAHVVLGRIPPHLLGGEIPLDVDAARAGIEDLAAKLGLDPERCATGILEISAWNQANALRQVTVKRGLDVRDFTLTTFGGSGSLLLCRLIDILGLAGVLVPPNPGNVSAFGLLTVDVKNDYVQTHVASHTGLDPSAVPVLDELTDQAAAALDARASTASAPVRAHRRPALLRPGLRGPGAGARRDRRRGARRAGGRRFHAEHRALYGYDFRDDPRQQVEWVNLRVTGIGPIRRPSCARCRTRATPRAPTRARHGQRAGVASTPTGYVDTPVYWRPTSRRRHRRPGRRSSRSSARPCPLHPGFTARVDASATCRHHQGE